MAIYKKALNHWKLAKRREDLQLKDFEPNVTLGAFNEGGNYRHCLISIQLMQNNL